MVTWTAQLLCFVIKSNIGKYESEPAENAGKLFDAYQPEAILF